MRRSPERTGWSGSRSWPETTEGNLAPAGPREEYFPLYYIEPYIGNETVLGLDLATHAACAAELRKAGDTNRAVVTRLDLPSSDARPGSAFAVLLPVYEEGGLLYSVDERRKNLRGLVVGVFRFDDLVRNALELLDSGGIDISLSDVGEPGREVQFYQYHPGSHTTGDLEFARTQALPASALHWEETLDVCGHQWLVRCVATPDFAGRHSSSAAWWVLAGGLLFTAILAAWAAVLIGQAARVQALVEQRTLALRESEAHLKEAVQTAIAATKAKSEFLANMSHEIRTPMTAILGFADVLLERGNIREAPPDRIEAVRTIKRNGEYLLSLINDILDLSKVEAGRMSVESIPCHPCQTIAEVASLVGAKAVGQGLSFNIEYDGAIPRTVQTDPTRLRQILINMIGNAIKFTELGSVRLITRFVSENGGPHLQFDVVDTGIGMTPDQVAKLFRPFTQADASTTRKFGGTGLGLTISKYFAELLGGDISVVNTQVGNGSHFRLTVAIGALDGVEMIQDPMTATVVSGAATRSGDDESGLHGCRVLLAEDGPDNQRLISHFLKKAGADVTVKENGRLALEAALTAHDEGCPFDVILMDMQMPVMDGYEAARSLRKEGYRAPIIALTAHAMASDRHKCLDAGCDDYAKKPIDRKALIAAIRAQLGSPAPV